VYEDQTFEVILQRLLDRIPDDVDKRKDSVIYDALAAAALEIEQIYIEFDNNLELGFADTSNGEWLEKRTSEYGIYREPAVKAVREATFNIPVGVGERFFVDDLYFSVIKEGTTAQIECEVAGEIGNVPLSGSLLLPVNTIPGLTQAVLGDILIPGSDIEDDESLFIRYTNKINKQPTSGNKNHYLEWASEVDGVGTAKIFPLWNGDNTVKIVIVDSTMAPASATLVQKVQDYIDPGSRGLGEGEAPIGAFCTVESAVAKAIDVSATLTLLPGKTLADAQTEIQQALDQYFKEMAFKDTVVRYAYIGSLILNAASVEDYSNLLVNGVSSNLQLLETEIPTLGAVTFIE
jgi:uncharacterized phage protein gp47/JayE